MVCVHNYTGDRLNFGLAVERAQQMGLNVDYVMTGEDCALASTDKTAGRRGLVGAIVVMKVCVVHTQALTSVPTFITACSIGAQGHDKSVWRF